MSPIDAQGPTLGRLLIALIVLGWMSVVVGAFLVENSAYFQEKLRVFLPLILGR